MPYEKGRTNILCLMLAVYLTGRCFQPFQPQRVTGRIVTEAEGRAVAEAPEAVNRRAVGEPRGGVAGHRGPGRRRHGNRPRFKNGTVGLSETECFPFLC